MATSTVKSVKKSTVKKSTRKTTVKEQTQATAPELKKYYNNGDVNTFTAQGRVKPGDSVMLTEEEASIHKDLHLV